MKITWIDASDELKKQIVLSNIYIKAHCPLCNMDSQYIVTSLDNLINMDKTPCNFCSKISI